VKCIHHHSRWLPFTAQARYSGPVLTTTEVAAKAQTTRYTVEREIRRGNLKAGKVGRQWAVEEAEADRWAARFQPYAGLRKRGTPAT